MQLLEDCLDSGEFRRVWLSDGKCDLGQSRPHERGRRGRLGRVTLVLLTQTRFNPGDVEQQPVGRPKA